MVRRQIRISKPVMFTWLMLVALICFCLPQALTGRLHLAFMGMYKYVPSFMSNGVTMAAATTVSPDETVSKDYQQLKAQYIQLQNHRDNLWNELASEHRKNERLAGMRSRFPTLAGAGLVDADIITAPSALKTSELIINRGSSDGLKKDQFVLGDNGIIGKVSDVAARTAVVRLISDKASAMPVEVAGTKVARMMRGDGRGYAHIKMVPKKYKIEKNAAVYTCKAPGVLDVGMIAGKVVSYKPDDDNPLLWDIYVKPASNIENLACVQVVVMNP